MADKKITMIYGFLTSLASKVTCMFRGQSTDVQSALDDIDERVNTQYEPFTATSAQGITVTCTRVGFLCTMTFGGRGTVTWPSGDWLSLSDITVPREYIPTQIVTAVGADIDAASAVAYAGIWSDDGDASRNCHPGINPVLYGASGQSKQIAPRTALVYVAKY